jgi:hypothetical protein
VMISSKKVKMRMIKFHKLKMTLIHQLDKMLLKKQVLLRFQAQLRSQENSQERKG